MTEDQILTTIEYAAVGLNILYILFAAKEKRVAWVFGGIASLISVYLFYKSSLISEAQLYIFYFIMAIIGFIYWGKNKSDKPIIKLQWFHHLAIISVGILLSLIFIMIAGYAILATKVDFVILDALTTSFSIIATFMTIGKILSNWIYWIVIDILSIYMYFIKELDIYAIQMVVFTILAVVAFFQWNKTYKLQKLKHEA